MSRNALLIIVSFIALSFVSCGDGGNQSAQNQEQVIPPAPPDAEPGPDEVIKVDEYPAPLKTVNPAYPEKSRKEGVEGTVWVNVLVNKEGTVAKASVTKREGGSEELEQAALDAIKQWTFKPAKVSGQPVSIWVAIPVRFKLADK
jgi:protein TonB